jgi:hypothetical protein
VFSLDRPLLPPANVTATPLATDTIRLTWSNPEGVEQVRIARTAEGDTTGITTLVDGGSFDDSGLTEATTYFYELSSLAGGDESTATAVQATTLSFNPVFAAVLPSSQSGQANKCVVQRIEPVRLVNGGSTVRITVKAPVDGGVLLERVTISGAADAAYDAAADLTTVATTVFVQAGTSQPLPVVSYALDSAAPLLVAFDIGAPGNLAFLPNVPGVEASAFVGDAPAAALTDRPDGFALRDRVYLIEKIEAV